LITTSLFLEAPPPRDRTEVSVVTDEGGKRDCIQSDD
jgi:hypothetical protein